MTAPTHIAFGLLTVASSFSLFSMSFHRNLPAVACAIIGSLLPDVDSPRSSIGRAMPFASIPIERRWGHRSITHSLLCMLALSVVTLPLLAWETACYAAILIGYMSHLIADSTTKSGVPLFYPHLAVCVFPGSARYRIKTGSLMGEGTVLAVVIILLLAFMPISNMGGIWRSFRYLMATPSAAYSDYRRANTETYLNFEGQWRHTREKVSGKALILDARPAWFWIFFNGRVLTCGEHGAILPDKVRVEETDRPVRIQTIRLKGETWQELVKRIPANSFVSGLLEADASFEVGEEERLGGAVSFTTREIEFKFAQKKEILRFQPILRGLTQRIKELSRAEQEIYEKLEDLKMAYPPVHYLKRWQVERTGEKAERYRGPETHTGAIQGGVTYSFNRRTTMIYNVMFLCGLFLMLIAARGNAQELMLRVPLVPARSATVYAGMNARMQQVNFEVGDRVTQGDTLMVLTRRDLRVKEASARIALKKAQILKARLEMLHDKKLISDQQLENVRFDAEVAHYNWVAARMELDRTAIIAPQDGMVVEVNVKVGDWILAYTAVARVIDHMDLQVHLLVPEDMLNAIHKNMPLSAVTTAGGKRVLRGRVIEISPVIDPENGTCKVTGLFLNAGKYVRPGALVNVTIGR